MDIETKVRRLKHYMGDIEKGLLRIPAFQRDFVWSFNDMLDLFDSLKKGFPIGSIMLWIPENNNFKVKEAAHLK